MANIFIFLDLCSVLVIFLLGYYVFLKDTKRLVNRLFFILTLTLTILATSSFQLRLIGFKPGFPAEEAIKLIPEEKLYLFNFWNWVGWIGIAFVASILLHLTLVILKKKKILEKKKYYIFIIYLLSFLFLFWVSFSKTAENNFYFYLLFTIYFISTCLVSFVLLLKEYFTLKSPQEKIKIGYFILGFSIPALGAIVLDVLIPLAKFHEFLGITYSLYFTTLGYVFIAIGVLRHGLFIDYREILETIFKRLAELVIVTDKEGLILLTNEITQAKLNFKEEEILNQNIYHLFREKESWSTLKEKLKKQEETLEEKITLLTKEKEEIPFLASISKTKKGVILVGRDIKELLSYQEKLKEEVEKRTRELKEAKSILEVKVKARTKELQELADSLEEQVKQRTQELQKRVEELERFHKLTLGRELKMIELKREIERLRRKRGED